MITVYAAYNVPPPVKGLVRDLRVMWALEELAMPYGCHWMDIGKQEHKIDPNRSINPFGKIPSFSDGDVKLFESGAIVHYLYDKAGKLPQTPRARSELLQWMFAALNTVEPPFLDLAIWDAFWKDRPGREVRYPELMEVCKTRLGELERALGQEELSARRIRTGRHPDDDGAQFRKACAGDLRRRACRKRLSRTLPCASRLSDGARQTGRGPTSRRGLGQHICSTSPQGGR